MSAAMAENGCDYLADLTTAPIFEDAVYLSEALGFLEGQNEDDVDTHLAMSARESGIEDPYRLLCPDLHDVSTALSTMTVGSDRTSSMSIHSRETQSTGITSHPSRTSKDHTWIESTPALRAPPPPPAHIRESTSFECYDTVLDHFRPSVAHRPSSSTFSGSNSTQSSASAQPKPPLRKHKRGSGLFSIFRRDSSACSSRSHHGHHNNPLNHKLKCGHALSKYAIRVHVQEALESEERIAPSCCGTRLPRSVLETVLTKNEVDIVIAEQVESPPFSGSLRDSGYSEDGISSDDLPRALDTPSHPTGSFLTAPNTPNLESAQEAEARLNLALANEAFISLRTQQKEQFQRVSSFESNQRKALSAYHQWSLKRLSLDLEKNKAAKTKQHALDLERLDESQIVAEHDLRKAHAQETQNIATALKYMEAYCSSGSSLMNSGIAHTITEDDRQTLARQHIVQQKLPAKHESAINVLRARQEKDAKMKIQKQQAEMQLLTTNYENEKQEEELQYMKDSSRLDVLTETRRARLSHRWDLKFEMWRRDWESQHGTTLNGRLPHEEWPQSIDVEGPLDASSSLALYSLVTA